MQGLDRIQVGQRVWIGPNSVISVDSTSPGNAPAIVIGDDVKIGRDCTITTGEKRRIEIGAGCSFHSGCYVGGDVKIGAHCVFSANIFMSSSDHLFDVKPHLLIREQDALWEDLLARGTQVVQPISIGEDCWLGWGVVVRKGVRIGRGAVIGANSVVTKDVPPYSIAAGAPAKVVKQRMKFAPPLNLN